MSNIKYKFKNNFRNRYNKRNFYKKKAGKSYRINKRKIRRVAND